MKKYLFGMILSLLLVSTGASANSMPWTAQEKYLYGGLRIDPQTSQVLPDLDIYTGDSPLVFHITSEDLVLFTGLPMHRPTPFFFSAGTENQVGFLNAYDRRTLFQSASLGFSWDFFGDDSFDKFVSLGSRFDDLSSGLRFSENDQNLQLSLQYDTWRFSAFAEAGYSFSEKDITGLSAGLDFRIGTFSTFRLSYDAEDGIFVGFGISHYDPALDLAAEFDWDYTGAHRGSMLHRPENTREAFDYAMSRDDISFIETDMNITADGEYVAIHDLNFLRYNGHTASISDLELSEIQQFDMGSYYSRDYTGAQALSLEETAEHLADFSDQGFVMLEVKLVGEGEEAMQRFLDRAREAYDESVQISYMTLYYQNADLLPGLLNQDDTWGLCYINNPHLLPFIHISGFYYPYAAREIENVVETYDPDYIIMTTDFMEHYDLYRELSAELGIDILFWDFKDTIYGISADGGDGPSFLDR